VERAIQGRGRDAASCRDGVQDRSTPERERLSSTSPRRESFEFSASPGGDEESPSDPPDGPRRPSGDFGGSDPRIGERRPHDPLASLRVLVWERDPRLSGEEVGRLLFYCHGSPSGALLDHHTRSVRLRDPGDRVRGTFLAFRPDPSSWAGWEDRILLAVAHGLDEYELVGVRFRHADLVHRWDELDPAPGETVEIELISRPGDGDRCYRYSVVTQRTDVPEILALA